MRWVALCGLLSWLIHGGTALAMGITATVDRTEVTPGEQITLRINVDGSQLTEPTLPDLRAFDVYPGGTSRQMNMINGTVSSNVTYSYVLVPKAAGNIRVGAASVQIDGEVYTSSPFTIRVSRDVVTPKKQRGNVFVTGSVSNKNPYAGEQIIYTLRIFVRAQLASASIDMPDFDAFVSEALGDKREYNKVVGGKQYTVTEFRRALFAQTAGSVVVPGAALTAEVIERRQRGFGLFDIAPMRGRRGVFRSHPITLTVRPLPAASKNFSDLIGKFKISAQLSKAELKVGETTTLTVVVSGAGNVGAIRDPMNLVLDGFKIYPDKPVMKINKEGKMLRGSKTFRKGLVPTHHGTQQLPAIELVYFSPTSGSYKTARTKTMPITIHPADGKEELRLTELMTSSSGKIAVRVIADDIRPPYVALDAIKRTGMGLTPAALALCLPPFMFLGIFLWRNRINREASDGRLLRRRKARGAGLKILQNLKDDNAAGIAVETSKALRRYIGDVLGIEGLALTPEDAALRLEDAGVDEPLKKEVAAYLRQCEALQYDAAGNSFTPNTRTHGGVRTAKNLIQRLDKCMMKVAS